MKISSIKEDRVIVAIYDALGSKKRQKSIELFSGQNTIQWDVSDLPSGVYQILLETKGAPQSIRFIKERD